MKLSLAHELSNAMIRFEADGYEPLTVPRAKVFSGTVVLDIMLWPTFFVDLGTHNMQHFPNDPIRAELKKR